MATQAPAPYVIPSVDFTGEFTTLRGKMQLMIPRPQSFATLEAELGYNLRIGAFNLLIPKVAGVLHWKGEDGVFGAVSNGLADYANPSDRPPRPDIEVVYELILFDDRDFGGRIANQILTAAGRQPRAA